MRIKAFVLINAELGKEGEVVKELRKLENVREANEVYGVYDIVAKIEVDDQEELKETVLAEIRSIDGVHSTLTLIVTNNQP